MPTYNGVVLTDVFAALLRVRFLQKKLWRGWYGYLARSYRGADWTFMNYGFDDPKVGRLALEAADERDRFCVQLYDYVTASVDFEGTRVLEVGCGRGGGSSFIARYKKPQQMTGVDLSGEAIAFCRKTHHASGLDFRIGDAEQLPFADSLFDVVVNVESSHCYPNLKAFFREVHRVLKPEGHFLYADLRERSGIAEWENSLMASGFSLLREEDITPQVLSVLDQDNDRKMRLIDSLVPSVLRSSFQDFAGVRGSRIYEGFCTGSLRYLRFDARKHEIIAPARQKGRQMS
jgi:ubiquinone/menaquinone biosynthesis C-methylase UbiE